MGAEGGTQGDGVRVLPGTRRCCSPVKQLNLEPWFLHQECAVQLKKVD